MSDNYKTLYEKSRQKFLAFPQEPMIAHFGLESDGERIFVPSLDRVLTLSRADGSVSVDGTPVGSTTAMALYDALSRASDAPVLAGRWASFVDFGGNTAISHLETLRPEPDALRGKCGELEALFRRWGGEKERQGDVSYVLRFFSFFPVWLRFWDGDEEFPPQLNVLWDANSLRFMHYETLWYVFGALRELILQELN